MGQTKGAYHPEFLAGDRIRIRRREVLDQFKREWKYHHPLQDDQLAYGGSEAIIRIVSIYHGGDELYELEGVPGLWHECCLER
jgi:hypothetical protein